MNKIHAIFFIPFCVLFSCLARGQNNDLRIRGVPLPGRFPGAGIRMAIQDKAGLLWYFSNNGLYRYDGNEVLYFGLNTQPALPYSPLYYLQPDGKGNLWIAFNKGAARFDLKNWTITPLHADDWHPYQPLDKNFTAVACLPGGTVYFATRNGKVYRAENDKLQKVAEVAATVDNIAEPVPGQLWLASTTGLINISIDHGKYGAPRYYAFADTEGKAVSIYNICYDSTGKFLFASKRSAIFRGDVRNLDKHEDEASPGPGSPPLKGLVFPVPLPDRSADLFHSPFNIGNKYIGLLSGRTEESKRIYTFDFDRSAWHLVSPSFAVNFPGYITYISRYPNGAFVASSEGLTDIACQKIPLTPILNGVDSKNSIRAIYKKDSILLIGSYRDGLMQYNVHTQESKRLNAYLNIYTILPWNDDSLLLADEGQGLFWYIPRRNRLTAIPIKNRATKNIQEMATVLCRVNDSLVLEGTYQGVQLVNPLKETNYAVAKGPLSRVMQNLKINAILPVNDKGRLSSGQYRIATNSGVFTFDLARGNARYFLADSTNERIKQTAIFCLLAMPGETWMGSGGFGVMAADAAGRLIPMDWLNSRLTGQTIYSLLQCGNEVLLGTDHGLNVLHLKDSTISYYTAYDGLPADEFNQAAVFNDGKQAFLGTVNGIIRWRSAATDYKVKKAFPPVHIDHLTVVSEDNIKTEYYHFPYLPPDSQRIFIPADARYFSLTFGRPGEGNASLSYSYRLSPEDNWTDLGHKRAITFIKTPPGHYRLQFAFKAPGGKWISNSSSIPLTVAPDFLQTIYFKLSMVLIIVGIILLIFRYREGQRKKEHDLRIKIAGDLHDEVGSSLTRIWHQTQLASPAMENLKEVNARQGHARNVMQAIGDISQEAIAMMSDMVWSIDARFDTLEELVLRMKDYVYKLQQELETPLQFGITGKYDDQKISQVIRQNLLLLFKEIINNAVKYSGDQPIKIDLNLQGTQLVLEVANFYPSGENTSGTVQGGKGLQYIQRRVAKMSGKLHIEDAGNKYTVSVIVQKSS